MMKKIYGPVRSRGENFEKHKKSTCHIFPTFNTTFVLNNFFVGHTI